MMSGVLAAMEAAVLSCDMARVCRCWSNACRVSIEPVAQQKTTLTLRLLHQKCKKESPLAMLMDSPSRTSGIDALAWIRNDLLELIRIQVARHSFAARTPWLCNMKVLLT